MVGFIGNFESEFFAPAHLAGVVAEVAGNHVETAVAEAGDEEGLHAAIAHLVERPLDVVLPAPLAAQPGAHEGELGIDARPQALQENARDAADVDLTLQRAEPCLVIEQRVHVGTRRVSRPFARWA